MTLLSISMVWTLVLEAKVNIAVLSLYQTSRDRINGKYYQRVSDTFA